MAGIEVDTPELSVVLPAWNEEERLPATLRALHAALGPWDGTWEVIVVDDASRDATAAAAETGGARVVRHSVNRGKGAALTSGFRAASGRLLAMLDADLGDSAGEVLRLIEPVRQGSADMTVAVLEKPAGHRGGMGLVLGLSAWALRRFGAPPMRAPLSGQRVMTRDAWQAIGRLEPGFGIEMGLNLDAARLGLRILEVETRFRHRMTGRDLRGYLHRGRQFRDVLLVTLRRWAKRPRHG